MHDLQIKMTKEDFSILSMAISECILNYRLEIKRLDISQDNDSESTDGLEETLKVRIEEMENLSSKLVPEWLPGA